ncbi:hypothetical protein BpHYR1_035307 [Brachionus plicatilis]|uniref:Uncharacterized protein n=1 Tax=Brachionus plicatilis TaxID=10195 RepID=A0A3M7QNN0_BRAPC|nr:hypothetical protein BpHYR1_035307 [Brachionus plicatilis]
MYFKENQFPANFGRPFLRLLTNSSDSHFQKFGNFFLECFKFCVEHKNIKFGQVSQFSEFCSVLQNQYIGGTEDV